jgi:conjugal transfer mating pair stabilization protein TraG
MIVIFKFAGAMGKPIAPFDLVKYPAMVILLQQIFLSLNGSPKYMVIDETTNTPYSVGKLPLAIGESFALFSNMQRSILSALDKFYTTPNSLSFRNSGLGFAMSVHDSIATARPLNSAVMASFNAYMEDCLVNESGLNPSFKMRLNQSSSLIDDLKVNTNFITTYYSTIDGSASVEYCPNAWDKIASNLTTESRRFLSQLASSMGYDISPSANPSATEFGDKVGTVANHYLGMSQDAETYVTQSMLVNMNNQGVRTMSAMSGINLSAMAWMPAYAERKAQSAFYTSGFMAKKYMPIMQATLITIVICVSWILVLLTIAMHDIKYIRLFITLMLTISLWMIIASIMNFSFDLQLEKAIKTITYNVTTGAYQLVFKDALDSTIGDRLAMLGYISWLIPILAFALAKGSDVAFAGLFSMLGHAFGGAANAASNTSVDKQATGGHSAYSPDKGFSYGSSISGGSVSYFDETATYNRMHDMGGYPTSWIERELNGHTHTETANSAAKLNSVDGRVTDANVAGINAQHLENKTATAQQSLQETAQQVATRTREELFSVKEDGSFRYNAKEDASAREAYKQEFLKTFENAEALAKATGMSSEAAAQLYADAHASTGLKILGNGAEVAVGARGTLTGKGSTSESATSNITDKDIERLNRAMDTAMGRALAIDENKANTFSQSSGGKLSEAYSNLQAKQEALSVAESTQANLSKNRLIEYAQYMGETEYGFSHERAQTALQNLNAMGAEQASAEIGRILGAPKAIASAQNEINNTQIVDNFDYGAALANARQQNAQAGIDYRAAFEANKEFFADRGLISKANANTIGEDKMKELVNGAIGRGDNLKGSPDFVRAMPAPFDEIGISASNTVGTKRHNPFDPRNKK